MTLFIIYNMKSKLFRFEEVQKKKKNLGEFYDFHLQQRGAFVNYHLTD